MILLNTTACNPGWKHQGGTQTLPEVYQYFSPGRETSPAADSDGYPAWKTSTSSRVAFVLPEGWHWVMRGDDFMATKDGVFLQNISVERIHVAQVEQSDGMFPLAALSSKQWPFRTVKYLKKRLELGMSPTKAADVVLGSRASTPGVADFEVREVVAQTVSGYQGFKAVCDFRLDVQGRKTPYKTLYFGFLLDEWFYGVSYTAAQRYYFQKDAETFNSVLQSFRLVEK